MKSINIYLSKWRKCRSLLNLIILTAVLFISAGPFPLYGQNIPKNDRNPVFIVPEEALFGGLGRSNDKVPQKAALRSGKLPNGLSYYILENSLPAGRAYLSLAVNAGSVLENQDERGLAHFVEHMAFNGTKRFPKMELVDYLRSLGMRFGPEVNAYTSFDHTVYGIEVPTEQGEDGIKRIPDKGLAILDDWSYAISFEPEDVEKERAVVLEEERTRRGAQERIRQELWPFILRGSPYADRMPIGLPEVIQKVTAQDLKAFYERWYRPDNMAVIFVGDFDGKVLENELAAQFTAPASNTPLQRPQHNLPEPQKGVLASKIITDHEIPFSTVYLYNRRSSLPLDRSLQYYRDNLIDYLIEIMIDFRFEEFVAAGDTPYMNFGSWTNRFGQSSRYHVMAAQSKAEQSGQTLEALLMEQRRLISHGFSAAELDRAKRALLADKERTEAEKDRRDSEGFANELTYDFLGEYIALDIEWELDALNRMLGGIGLITVNKTLQSYFEADDVSVLIIAPEKEKDGLPNENGIADLVTQSRTAEVPALDSKSVTLDLLSETPEPGHVTNITKDKSGAQIWELSNGLKLILMETTNKNNELDFYAMAKGGSASAAAGIKGGDLLDGLGFTNEQAWFSAMMAAQLQNASGLGSLSLAELKDFLADKQLSLSFWTNEYARIMRGSSTLRDLSYLFQMIHLSFAQPRIDENGMRLALDQQRTKLIQEADDPDSFFFKELTRLISNNHPLEEPLKLEDLEHIDKTAALAFLTMALNPADYTMVIAGSLGDLAQLKSLAERYLASIPCDTLPNWNDWAYPEITRPQNAEKYIFKGTEDRCVVYQSWFKPKTWTEKENAAALVLSEYVEIVFNDDIRETLGGVYSISSRCSFNVMPKGEMSLEVYFVCAPDREQELRNAVKERLADLARGNIDHEIFVKAKEALLKSFERSIESNGFIARNLAQFDLITRTPLSHFAQRPALYQSVTIKEMQDAATELIGGNHAQLIMLPEKK